MVQHMARPDGSTGRARGTSRDKALWIGGGAVLVGAVVLMLIPALPGTGAEEQAAHGPAVSLDALKAYVPDDALLMGAVDVRSARTGQTWKTFQVLLGKPYYQMQLAFVEKVGIGLDLINSAFVSVGLRSGWLCVLRCDVTLDPELLRYALRLEPVKESGTTLFRTRDGKGLHFPDSRTLVVGSLDAVRGAVRRVAKGRVSPAFARLDALRAHARSKQAWCVIARDPEQEGGTFGPDFAEGVKAVVLFGTVNGAINLRARVLADSPDAAQRVHQKLEAMLAGFKGEVGRESRRAAPSIASLIAGGALESLKLSRVEDTVVVALAMSRPDVTRLVGTAQQHRRTVGKRAVSRRNLRQIGLALHNYHDAHGTFPPGYVHGKTGAAASWATMIAPFVDETALYNSYNFDLTWDHATNHTTVRRQIRQLLVPGVEPTRTAKGHGVTHYVGICVGDPATSSLSILGRNSRVRVRDVRDGTSQTLLVGETALSPPAWAGPGGLRDVRRGIGKPGGFGGVFPGGAHFLFADGRVRFLTGKTDPKVLRALATCAGNEIIDDDAF